MLISGKFEDGRGVIYYIPMLTKYRAPTPEQQLIEAARDMARAMNIRVVKVWGTYQYEKQLTLT